MVRNISGYNIQREQSHKAYVLRARTTILLQLAVMRIETQVKTYLV